MARLRQNIKQRYSGRHGVFRSAVLHRFSKVLGSMTKDRPDAFSADEIYRHVSKYMDQIDDAFALAESGVTRVDKNPLFFNLREAFITKDLAGLEKAIHFGFQSLVNQGKFTKGIYNSQKTLLDFRYPMEWFPATRALQRTIHVHVGPTNSGKTYRALKALRESKRGVFAGPLRLLATEVYQRFTAEGIPCALVTGEEIRLPEDTDHYHTSCTVEMVPLNQRFDVAVIDEIQMIGDPSRGFAWTNALLGVQADEVHVCGEERAVDIVQRLCASIGDKCVVHRYERLSPLKAMTKAVSLDQLQKGDAVVAFTRQDLHIMKSKIEQHTGKRCAIVYGTLPPEVRVQQAALFNDPDNDYDYIVASDAIGMGLNLEIRRVIFESVFKYDGSTHRLLTVPELKQIGGRAGRYRSSRSSTHSDPQAEETEKMGYVSTLDERDLRSVHRSFTVVAPPLEAAIIEPPVALIEAFSTYFPAKTPLSFMLMRISEIATLSDLYRLGVDPHKLDMADMIQDIDMNIYDRLTLCHMPINIRAEGAVDVLRAFGRAIASKQGGDFLGIKEIPLGVLDERLDMYMREGKVSNKDGANYLYRIESLHHAINAYLWLSYRYTHIFKDQALAFHVRELVEQRLMENLEHLNYTDSQLEQRRRMRRGLASKRESRRTKTAVDAKGGASTTTDEHAEDDPPIDDGLGPEPQVNVDSAAQQVRA